MKIFTCLLPFFWITFPYYIQAQEGKSTLHYVNTNHVWYKEQFFQSQAPESRMEYFSPDSTLLNGKYYFELYSFDDLDETNPTSKGFFRQEGDQVYKYIQNYEAIYLDFPLEKDDEFTLMELEFFIVTDVDNVTFSDGIERKRISFHCRDSEMDDRIFYMIEGIGLIEDYNPAFCDLLIDIPLTLMCFETYGEVIYSNLNFSSCWVSTKNYASDPFFQIFPNPTTNKINIVTENITDYQDYTILDLYGKRLSKHSELSSEMELDVSPLTPGIYFLQIRHKKGKFSFKKFIKTK